MFLLLFTIIATIISIIAFPGITAIITDCVASRLHKKVLNYHNLKFKCKNPIIANVLKTLQRAAPIIIPCRQKGVAVHHRDNGEIMDNKHKKNKDKKLISDLNKVRLFKL